MDYAVANTRFYFRSLDVRHVGKKAVRIITVVCFVAGLFLLFSFMKIFDETYDIGSSSTGKEPDMLIDIVEPKVLCILVGEV